MEQYFTWNTLITYCYTRCILEKRGCLLFLSRVAPRIKRKLRINEASPLYTVFLFVLTQTRILITKYCFRVKSVGQMDNARLIFSEGANKWKSWVTVPRERKYETQKLNRVKRVSGIYCLLRTYESIARHVTPCKNEFPLGNCGK